MAQLQLTYDEFMARNFKKCDIERVKINNNIVRSSCASKVFSAIAKKTTYQTLINTIFRHKFLLEHSNDTNKRFNFTDYNNQKISMNRASKQTLIEDIIKIVQVNRHITNFYIKIRLSSNEVIYYEYN